MHKIFKIINNKKENGIIIPIILDEVAKAQNKENIAKGRPAIKLEEEENNIVPKYYSS